MVNSMLPSGLSLINNSPFLVGVVDSLCLDDEVLMTTSLKQTHTENLMLEGNISMYSEIHELLNQELLDDHLLNLTEQSLRETSTDHLLSERLRAGLSVDDPPANVLELRLLIEQSLMQNTPTDGQRALSRILSLGELEELQREVARSTYECTRLERRLAITMELMAQEIQALSTSTEARWFKSTYDSIHSRLAERKKQLQQQTATLSNHHFSCLSLGYIDNLRLIPHREQSDTGSIANKSHSAREAQDKSSAALDGLFSHVAALAVERGLTLPEPDDNSSSLAGKVAWVLKCIDGLVQALLGGDRGQVLDSPTRRAPQDVYSKAERAGWQQQQLATDPDGELRTAFTDLQFAHKFLITSFETERQKFDMTVTELTNANTSLQREVKQATTAMKVATKQALTRLIEKAELELAVEAAAAEIQTLEKQLHTLRLESMGYRALSSHTGSTSGLLTPLHATSSPFSPTMAAVNDLTSVGILRQEFKQMMAEMEQKHEAALQAERAERKKLEQQLQKAG